jgi:hypothetical protein
VKKVAGHDDQLRPLGDHAVHGRSEGIGYIMLTLIDAGSRLPVILADAKMRVCEVCDSHTVENGCPSAEGQAGRVPCPLGSCVAKFAA